MKKAFVLSVVLMIAFLVVYHVEATDCTKKCVDNPLCKGMTAICNPSQCVTLKVPGNCRGQFAVTYAASTPQVEGLGYIRLAGVQPNVYCKTTASCQSYMAISPSKCLADGFHCSVNNFDCEPDDICASCHPDGLPVDWVVNHAICASCDEGG